MATARTVRRVTGGCPDAQRLLTQTSAALPVDLRSALVLAPGASLVPAARVLDPVWLGEQICGSAQLWRTDDRRVLTTIWWYSASMWLQMPSLASLLVVGRPLSPGLPDLSLHERSGLYEGATSTAVLQGLPELAVSLRVTLGRVVEVLGEIGRVRTRPLWAIAADSTANALLRLGVATGQVEVATALAVELGRLVGPPLPLPVYVQAGPRRAETRVRRASCCLLHLSPGLPMCRSCPQLGPEERLR